MSIFIFLLGLVFGSFVNVLIFRIPLGKNIGGRSICPRCKSKIAWYDNIPIISYLLLRAKCRKCRKPISFIYPLVEFAGGVIYLLLFWRFGYNLQSIVYYLTTPILLAVFVIDYKHGIIPDELSFAGYAISLLNLILFYPHIFYTNLFVGFMASLFFLILHLATLGKGMGLGDVKFVLFAATILGLKKVIPFIEIAFLTGALVGCILILMKASKLKSKIVFGPFLVVSFILTVLFW